MLDKILSPYEDMTREGARGEVVRRMGRKEKCELHFLRDEFQFFYPDSNHVLAGPSELDVHKWRR
ncbi:MAG: hypothetical protein ACLQDM_28805 [Bradyrhizobium sp.]